ncbi:MAG TPA: hypothetical protein VM890_10825 [Longimicrobium sp.]|nr:hypothetical protein [Longimicrobium sp.]
MKIHRALLVTAAALAVAACSDRSSSPLAPAPAAPAHALSGSIDVSGLLTYAGAPNLTAPRHAEKRIVASQGGYVELQGFRVDIPAGALPQDTTVTIDLPTDAVLAKRVLAEFGPHGVQFNQPVTLTFPLVGVSLAGPVEVARWEGGQWVGLGGSVNALGTRLTGTTPHFSYYGGKYILAGG